MSWEAAGALSEMIGAAAVVVSVVYLAIQVRTASKAATTTLRDAVFASLYQWNYHLTADAAFAAMFHRGLQDYESLSAEEKPRFIHTIYSFFKVFENIYRHFLQGAIDEATWSQNREPLFVFAHTPGGRLYLQSRKATFDPRFLQEVASGQAVYSLDPARDGAAA